MIDQEEKELGESSSLQRMSRSLSNRRRESFPKREYIEYARHVPESGRASSGCALREEKGSYV